MKHSNKGCKKHNAEHTCNCKVSKTEKTSKVEIDLPDKVILKLALMAHEKDITFNQLCNIILKDYLEKLKNAIS